MSKTKTHEILRSLIDIGIERKSKGIIKFLKDCSIYRAMNHSPKDLYRELMSKAIEEDDFEVIELLENNRDNFNEDNKLEHLIEDAL